MTTTSSIGGILQTASSGLAAAQVGLSSTSNNVSNANTPGYVRTVVDQSSLVSQGAGAGVTINGIQRVVNAYLEQTGLQATSQASSADILSSMLDQAQSLFGDPTGDSGFFSNLNTVFTQFAALANNPSSSLSQTSSIESVQDFLNGVSQAAGDLSTLQGQADGQIQSDVGQVNSLLANIAQMNAQIRQATVIGSDASGAENIQAQNISQLATLVNIQTSTNADGSIVVRSPDGMLLADQTAGTLNYNASATAASYLTVSPANGGGQTFNANFTSGEVTGLMQVRNAAIPDALSQLNQYAGQAVNLLNQVHNANSAVPAPSTLTGDNTGLDQQTAVGGFSGTTNIVVLNSAGVIQHKVTVDFTHGTMSLDGGSTSGFSASTFAADLTAKLAGSGTATYANGVLTLNATGGNGIAVVDDATTPSQKAGQGFSQFFGLNDLVQSSSFNGTTGLQSGDTNGFASGQTVTFRLTDSTGGLVKDVQFAVPAGATTVGGLVSAMSASVAPYGSFTLNSSGQLTFASGTNPAVRMTVPQDNTSWSGGGQSLSQFFGLGTANLAALASSYDVTPAINQNPGLLATAKVNLAAAANTVALSPGDASGASALANVGNLTANFSAAGDLPAASMTLNRYASQFAGSIASQASTADADSTSADAVKTEATTRLTSYEGVDMDEELINLTKYQQAFNASARMITAASQMYDTLISMVS